MNADNPSSENYAETVAQKLTLVSKPFCMYTEIVTGQDKALCHLFLHCCLRDGKFTEEEIDSVSGRFVELGLATKLNFKEEVISYRDYLRSIVDEREYLKYLLGYIHPVNEKALFSYCVELVLSDAELDPAEEILLEHLAALLHLSPENATLIKQVIVERKAVELQKIF